jgi:hypothetical protein
MADRAALPETRPVVSRFLKSRLGGDCSTRAYYDEPEEHAVAVVEAVGSPGPLLSTFSTASLHAVVNRLDGADLRVELMVTVRREHAVAANMVATSAFNVLKSGWLAAPGVVFPDVVREYVPSTTTPHLMWAEPFAFSGLGTVTLEGIAQDIHWLQGVPLSDREVDFLRVEGYDRLSARLEAEDAQYFDLTRSSTV